MDQKKIVRSILSNRKLTIADQINRIKLQINAGGFKEALKSHPAFLKTLHKAPFFQTLNDIHLREAYSFTKDFKKEFKWISNVLEDYFDVINAFLIYKNKFEEHILLDEFDMAKSIIKDVENLYGISLWSIEANLIIEEKINGSESNWNLLTHYLKEINNSIYEFTINSSSKRIETKLTYESFLNQFQNDIDSINSDGLIEDFFVFKNFNIVSYEYKYQNYESVLYVSNIFSIIDQYLILIDVILHNVSESDQYDNLFIPFIRAANNIIEHDVRIINIHNILNDKKELIEAKNNSIVFECLNYFYSGRFKNALEASELGIIKHPTEYEFYLLYCKSLINLNESFKPINSSKTINEILKETYNLLTFKKDEESSWNKLLKRSLVYMNTNFGKQIFGLINEVEGKSNRNYIIGFLSSSFNSHNNITLVSRRDKIIVNFEKLLAYNCFKTQLYKYNCDVDTNDIFSESDLQYQMFKAVRNYNQGNYLEVIQTLNSQVLLDKNPYYYENKNALLFQSFLELNALKDALILFGDIFFDNSMVTRKNNDVELFNKIKANSYKDDFTNLIEYPILFSLLVKEYDLYEAYDDFMCYYNILNIDQLEIDSFIEKHSLEKAIYFLDNVVTIDTLKYSTEYNSIGDVEEDRIKILKVLISIDPSNRLAYDKEINEIYRINSVRKVLKEVDEGRLYIDVGSLKDIQIKNFNDEFKRFKEIEASTNVQNLIGFNASNTKNWEKALTEKSEALEKYNSADYLAFKSIYLESRENFLFSKEYGLDSCLSTRIRHGALKNHIRSVFEKLNLVTSKFKDKYKENELWKSQLAGFPELNNNVQIQLKQFSKEVDDYTTFIVERLIQIQTEKTVDKEDGIFKFFTNDNTLFNYYTQNRASFETTDNIIEMLLTNLVNHTLLDLVKEINEVFSVTIPNKFQNIIDNTIGRLREFNLPNDCQLIPNLIKSSTEMQNELEEISNWFYLNTTSSTTLLSIETVIDASVELTNKINPNYHINPNINLRCAPFGVYSNLVFVFNILFNNIILHSNLSCEDINITIDIDSVDEKYFNINISNNVNKSFDYTNNIKRLNTIKDNWNNHSNIDRSNKEGESGFDKIKRILLYETLSKTDKFDFEIDNAQISIKLFFPYVKVQA